MKTTLKRPLLHPSTTVVTVILLARSPAISLARIWGEHIPKRFLEHLELRKIILEVADVLCLVQDNAYVLGSDPAIDEKYMDHVC